MRRFNLHISLIAMLVAVVASVEVAGQQRIAQPRTVTHASTSTTKSPASPTADRGFRSSATMSTRPVTPMQRVAPLRSGRLPVFALAWGWPGVPYSVDLGGPPLQDGPTGGVQLDVLPWRASVYVDGVYAGHVEDFRGYYKHLDVVAGPHRIIVVEAGYQTLAVDIDVVAGRTTTYRATLNESLR